VANWISWSTKITHKECGCCIRQSQDFTMIFTSFVLFCFYCRVHTSLAVKDPLQCSRL
jgi:hypothetical protein